MVNKNYVSGITIPGAQGGQDLRRALLGLLAALPDPVALARRYAQISDWEPHLRAASSHGIGGLLHHHRAEAGVRLPAALAAGVELLQAADRAMQARLRADLDAALAALAVAGVRAVALKGPLLGERLYPAPHLRPSSDIDLLVAEHELDRAAQALVAAGWHGEDSAAERHYRAHHHHVHLHREGATTIELHHHAHAGFGRRVPSGPLVARALRHGAGWVLSPEDEWLYLAVHAASHTWERLGWLYDLKQLVLLRPAIDWDAVTRRARELQVAHVAAFTRELLRTRLGVEIPERPGWASLPTGARQAMWLLLGAAEGEHGASSAAASAASFGLRLLLCDSPAASARLLVRKVRGRLAVGGGD